MPEKPPRTRVEVRLDPASARELEMLARRLHLTPARVLLLALARLAQAEGVAENEGVARALND